MGDSRVRDVDEGKKNRLICNILCIIVTDNGSTG
jgi:hypothetical protein